MYTAIFGFHRLLFTGTGASARLFTCPDLDEVHSRLQHLVEGMI